jgi:hypothetical protein
MVCEDTCIAKNKPELRIRRVLKFSPRNRAQGRATAFGSAGYFCWMGNGISTARDFRVR